MLGLGLAAGGTAAAAEGPVALPPFLVEAKAPLRWRYLAVPEGEILTRASDRATLELATQNHYLQTLLELILPRRLQFHTDVPMTYLLFDRDRAAIAPELLSRLQQRQAERLPGVRGDTAVEPPPWKTLPNYRFLDLDTAAAFFLWDENGVDVAQLRLTPSYVRFLLERRTPALPSWFIEGLLELYPDVAINAAPIRNGDALAATPFATYAVRLQPATWFNPELTRLMLKQKKARVEMLPLAEIFAPTPASLAEADDARRRRPAASTDKLIALPVDPAVPRGGRAAVQREQAKFFIRYMLDGDQPRREALWRLVERASEEPLDEALFRACTGLDYAAAERALQGYVREACRNEIVLHPATIPEFEPPPLRDATEGEVARLKGGFNRLEVPYVRQVYPEMAEFYLDQARRTLRRAYDAGERDPRLLAELGLCECDAGNDAGAEGFLLAAVEGRVVRPRAYYELARIRFLKAVSAAGDHAFTPAQTTEILQPLAHLRRQSPPLNPVYELMADTWLRSAGAPNAEWLRYLEEGPRLFPRQVRINFAVALLEAILDRRPEAQRLVSQGLAAASDPGERAQLLALQAKIEARNQTPARN